MEKLGSSSHFITKKTGWGAQTLDPFSSFPTKEFHTPAFSADETMVRAFVARPEMKALASQIRATELERKTAQDARVPRGWR
jgi:hypothetical protein